MKHFPVLFLFAALLASLFYSCTKNTNTKSMIQPMTLRPKGQIPSGPPLRVRGDHDYPPFEFVNEDGKPDGFNIEIFEAVAAAMHLNAVIDLGPWSEVRTELEQGQIDVITGMYKTKERDKKVDFTIPHFIASYNIFVRKSSEISGLDDIKNKKILVQKGDFGDDFVNEHHLGSAVIAKGDITETLTALSKGEGDCAVVAVLQGSIIKKKLKLRNLKVAGNPVVQEEYCIAVREGDSDLLAQLNEGLSIIKSNGIYDKIYDKWFGVIERRLYPNFRYIKILLIVLAVFFIILLLGFLWFRALRHQVAAKTKELRQELAARKAAQSRLESALREIEKAKKSAEVSREEAEEANQIKTQFLANMSHELRTPLNGVTGMLNILKKMNLNADQMYFLEMAEYSADHLLDIIQDILDFSKIESGRLEIFADRFDTGRLIRQIAGLQTAEATKKGLAINIAPVEGDVFFFGDETRISQILFNLLSNAIKYSEKGTITITAKIDQELVISVADEGIGIPEDQIETVFQSFRQLEDPYTKQHGGSGLGLSIVKELVELMNGSIQVESEPGKGSRFTVRIPPAEADERRTLPEKEERIPAEGDRSRSYTILVVEDERINLFYLTQILEGPRHRIITAGTGEDAVEKAREIPPHLVFMDIGLPGMNGIDAAKAIRNEYPGRDIPVIALTAHSNKNDIELFLREGMDAVITKPYQEIEIFRVIEEILG